MKFSQQAEQKDRLVTTVLLLAILLSLLLPGTLVPTVYAARNDAVQAAEELHSLGLLQGVGSNADGSPNFALDRPMSRAEGITMLVRMLGMEGEALDGSWTTPFLDVPDWAAPYIGWAYENHYVNGTGAGTFASKDALTAAHYITLVLRALGYSSSADFQWDHPWILSDQIGLTNGQYSDKNPKTFLRADAVLISASALDTRPNGGGRTLRERLATDQGDQSGQETPDATDLKSRVLTDAEITDLKGKSPSELKTAISTFADAQAYINSTFDSFWAVQALGGSGGNWPFPSGEELFTWGGNIAPNTYAACVTYLLSDDFEIYTIYATRQECVYHDDFPVKVVNCIRTQNGYAFLHPCSMSQVPEEHGGSFDVLLPEAETSSLKEYAEIVAGDPAMQDVTNLYAVKNGVRITTGMDGDWMVVKKPEVEPFWSANREEMLDKINSEIFAYAKPENIQNYKIASMLGGITLSVEDAYALADEDPEVIKDKVKTAGDVLMYMMAAHFRPRDGSEAITVDGHTWNYNWSAEENIKDHSINCGGGANMVTYLLEGDYEEVGFIMLSYYPGMGGGHVYNYFKYQGEYYIVDYRLYVDFYYNNDPSIRKLKTLKDYGSYVNVDYGGVCLALGFTTTGQHLPNVWEGNYYYVPAGSNYEVLYEANDGFKLGELPLDTTKLDWRKF